LFDRVLNHYFSSSEKQLFIHVNDEVETSKFLCIDMISKHLHYHARQKLESCSIIRAVLIDVAIHNIQSITLHQLLALFVQTQFNELDSNRLARLQRIFRHCKLLIIDEKSMIELRFLYKIDYKLRAICVQFDRFFDEMNVMLCENFAQLSFVKDTSLYSRSRHSSSKTLIVMNVYRAFKKFFFLMKLMRQQEISSSAIQFRKTLNQMRDDLIFLNN
jgi:hypothetical protein